MTNSEFLDVKFGKNSDSGRSTTTRHILTIRRESTTPKLTLKLSVIYCNQDRPLASHLLKHIWMQKNHHGFGAAASRKCPQPYGLGPGLIGGESISWLAHQSSLWPFYSSDLFTEYRDYDHSLTHTYHTVSPSKQMSDIPVFHYTHSSPLHHPITNVNSSMIKYLNTLPAEPAIWSEDIWSYRKIW